MKMTIRVSTILTAKRTLLSVFAGCLFLLVGCDSTFVDPFSNNSNFFTIYGYLDEANNFANNGTHEVRVIPITRRAEVITSPADDQAFIDARVFVINTFTGQETEWRHSLERVSENQYAHIFRSGMFVNQNTIYRIEVRRSDDIVTSAETFVPAVSTTNIIQDPQPFIDPSTSEVRQGILIPGVHTVWDMDVIYYMGGSDCLATSPIRTFYDRTGEYNGEGWRFEANVSRDLDGANVGGEPINPGSILCAIGIETRVPDVQWTLPRTQAGVDSLEFSNVPSNVENGLGFFGSVGVIQNAWKTTDALRSALNQ